MAHADRQTRVFELLAHPDGEQALRKAVPQLFLAPEIPEPARQMVVGTLLDLLKVPPVAIDAFLVELEGVPVEVLPEAAPIAPDPGYESVAVPRGSASLVAPDAAEQFATVELRLDGPSHGNPFVDVDLWADFRSEDRIVRCGGFYDGGGRYLIRFLPPTPGVWRYETGSTARSLDGIAGEIEVSASTHRGPVRADGFHFRHADGSPYAPIGTTLYAWTHQDEAREELTLATLAAGPFTKVRMCVFPKHYDFTHEDPPRYPFERASDGEWDTTRFDPDFFRHLERRIDDLARLGIQADVILFHPYDRWGFQALGVAADDRYVRYVVRRLAGFANVWWSLANEYDLMWSKREPDWQRIGRLVAAEDHAGHLLSIHNGTRLFDFSAEWITHCSIQKTDEESPVPRVEEWRARWGKPVVIDELGYEGDIGYDWGGLSAQELVHRFWGIAMRGAHATHGETYQNPESRLWWATGGELVGASPERIALLRRCIEESPEGRLEPLPRHSHVKAAGVEGSYELYWFGYFQPATFDIRWPEGRAAIVDVIDTWAMTVETLEGPFVGPFTVELPGRPQLVLRVRESERDAIRGGQE